MCLRIRRGDVTKTRTLVREARRSGRMIAVWKRLHRVPADGPHEGATAGFRVMAPRRGDFSYHQGRNVATGQLDVRPRTYGDAKREYHGGVLHAYLQGAPQARMKMKEIREAHRRMYGSKNKILVRCWVRADDVVEVGESKNQIVVRALTIRPATWAAIQRGEVVCR